MAIQEEFKKCRILAILLLDSRKTHKKLSNRISAEFQEKKIFSDPLRRQNRKTKPEKHQSWHEKLKTRH